MPSSSASLLGPLSSGMFSHQAVKTITLLIVWPLIILLATQIADPDANGIAVLLRWLTGLAFVVSVISPKTGIYMVLLTCPILDFIKRLLTLYDNANLLDVTSVLALAPVIMGGAILGTFASRLLFKKKLFEPGEGMLFVIMAAISSCVAIGSILHSTDSKLTLLKQFGEGCVYLGLIFMVSVHFRRQEDITHLLRLCVLIFVPVAIYGFWQKVFGLTSFEERYLMSGLTVTQGDYLDSARIFSTLNSNHSFSVTMACCAVLALVQRHLPSHGGWQKMLRQTGVFLFVLFLAACLVSLRRTGWLTIFISLFGAFCFKSRARTYVFYTVCVSMGALIIFNAQYLLTVLPYWDYLILKVIPGGGDAFHLQTFNDRLFSFTNLTGASGMWSFFGLPAGEKGLYYVHDAISEALVNYGAVPLVAFIGMLIFALRLSHRLVWQEQDISRRQYIVFLLSLVFANLFIGAMMQSHIGIFPINFIFWFCVGALLKTVLQDQAALRLSLKTPRQPPKNEARVGTPIDRSGQISYGH